MATWRTLADRAVEHAIADSGSTDPADWPRCARSRGVLDPLQPAAWEPIADRAVRDAAADGLTIGGPGAEHEHAAAILAAAERQRLRREHRATAPTTAYSDAKGIPRVGPERGAERWSAAAARAAAPAALVALVDGDEPEPKDG